MGTSFQEICKRFEKLDCASMCDASPLVKAFTPGLVSLHPHLKLIGRIFPISCSNDYLTVVKGLSEAKEGDILVIDGHGHKRAIFGELLSAEAMRRGIRGAVVNGAVRDIGGMRGLDFPVYYRYNTPHAGRAEMVEVQSEMISICNVTAIAGDWIFGDADGLVTVPASQAVEIISVAEEIQDVEAKVLENIRRGESLTRIMKFEEFCREHDRDIRATLDFHLSGGK